MSASPWKLDCHVAQLALDSLRATLDLSDPASGLQELRLGPLKLRDTLLGVILKPHVDTTPTDVYVRGDDLVATYPQSAGRPMRVQVYWRCTSRLTRISIELQVSVQTDLLGIGTPVVARSRLEVIEALRLKPGGDSALSIKPGKPQSLSPQDGPGALLFRLPQAQWSYAEMIHAADFQQDELSLQDTSTGSRRATLEHRLFPESLEKGVILRARIRGLFVPRKDDAAAAAEDYEEFLRSPLPLTT